MMLYCDIPSLGKTLISSYLFVILCVCVFVIPFVKNNRGVTDKLVLSLCTLTSTLMAIVYATDIRIVKQNRVDNPFVRWVCNQPFVFTAIIILIITAYIAYTIVKETKKHKGRITRSSVKEGIDKLNSGLCFAYENGSVILANNIMAELSHSILGRDLQNAKIFWEALSEGNVKDNVMCLSIGEKPSFRLPDGRVWTFGRCVIDGIVQLTAADATKLRRLTDELKEKNKSLEAINARLYAYGEKVDELTRAKERLETKINIHRSLGQALLITRHYLINADGATEPPFDIWEQNIAMLSLEIEQPNEDPFEMFIKAAKTAGVSIVMTGEVPEYDETRNLIALAAAESLVNAVRHADASALYIEFEEKNNMYTVKFTNNGKCPKGKITEGGGLGALRKKTERAGGIMEIEQNPEFALIISMPKKGETNATDNDC